DQSAAEDVARTPLGARLAVIQLARGADLALFVVGPLLGVDLRSIVRVAHLLGELLVLLDPILLRAGPAGQTSGAKRRGRHTDASQFEEAASRRTRNGIPHLTSLLDSSSADRLLMRPRRRRAG